MVTFPTQQKDIPYLSLETNGLSEHMLELVEREQIREGPWKMEFLNTKEDAISDEHGICFYAGQVQLLAGKAWLFSLSCASTSALQLISTVLKDRPLSFPPTSSLGSMRNVL